MAGKRPPHRIDHPVSTQRWHSISFLHWAVDPRMIAAVLPQGLEPDIRDGAAWITLSPFLMRSVRLTPLPPVPGLSTFPETNLRTYVRCRDGTDGVYFLSVDCARLLAVLSLRLMNLPYTWSRMSVHRDDRLLRYRSRRRAPGPRACSRLDLRVGDVVPEDEQSALDIWLSGRWHTYTSLFGRLVEVPVAHQPWPLRRAELIEYDDELLASAGFDGLGPPRLVRFSSGVDAKVGRPRIADMAAGRGPVHG